jgi:hypothetical protein
MKTHWDGLQILIADEGMIDGCCQLTSENATVSYQPPCKLNDLVSMRKEHAILVARDKYFAHLASPTEIVINIGSLRELLSL